MADAQDKKMAELDPDDELSPPPSTRKPTRLTRQQKQQVERQPQQQFQQHQPIGQPVGQYPGPMPPDVLQLLWTDYLERGGEPISPPQTAMTAWTHLQQQQQVPFQQRQQNSGWPQRQQYPPMIVQQPTFMAVATGLGKYGARFKAEASKGLGGTMIFFALISFGLAAVAVVFGPWNSSFYAGFWCAAMFLVGGSVACHAGGQRQDCAIILNIVTSFLSLCLASALIAISVIAMLSDLSLLNDTSYYTNYKNYGCPPPYNENYNQYTGGCSITITFIMDCCLIGIGFMEWVLSLPLFIITLQGVCCRGAQVGVDNNVTMIPVQQYGGVGGVVGGRGY